MANYSYGRRDVWTCPGFVDQGVHGSGGAPNETYPGFVHTVLVDMRARLRDSDDPGRVFSVTTDVARGAGLVGVRRVLDSAPLYDAVATQDTVTLIRSAIRGVLEALEARSLTPACSASGGTTRYRHRRRHTPATPDR